MKKLLLGIMVALCAFIFSAFTTKNSSLFLNKMYALGTDGNYHLIIYNEGNCIPNPGTYCAYQWYNSGGPGSDIISPSLFNAYVAAGYLTPYGPVNYKYLPD